MDSPAPPVVSAPVADAAATRFVALVGNPNVGKSTLFNALTGLRQRVANYPGVTVDAREGTVAAGGAVVRLADLPGTYSLRPTSADEAVVERVLQLGDGVRPPDVVLVCLDATNLRRNLFLLSEVLDLGRPVVVALNMVDEARRGGMEVPTDRLREATGCPVIETVATTGEGAEELKAALLGPPPTPPARRWRFEDPALEERLAAVPQERAWERLKTLRSEEPSLREPEIAGRYAWITEFQAGAKDELPRLRARSDKIDAVLLHPVAGPAIFLLVMGLVFQSIFTWAGPLMDGTEAAVGAFGGWLTAVLPPLIGAGATSLIVDGGVAGVGSVIVFLPQILILFFFLGLLEDTGYMARAAFLVDRPLRAVGLSGRSFIPILSSFACAIPGVMATRTIPNRFERLLAILVAPLMTCSARLPVYTLLIAAFVPSVTVFGFLSLQGLVLFGLYLSGMAAGALVAFIVSRSRRRRGRELPLVVELPPYRRPGLQSVLMKLRVRGGDFLKRAGTVIFAVSLVLWVLMAFPRAEKVPGLTDEEQAAVQRRQSIAGRMGQAIEPVIEPLGYDWKMGVGLIASFAAREVFVSTMGVIYSVGEDVDEEDEGLRSALQSAVHPDTGEKSFSLATVFSLLAFYVFALQCGATVAVVAREAGSWRFAAAQLVGYLALAWLAAFVTYQGMRALGY